jgi:hypothetical protein
MGHRQKNNDLIVESEGWVVRWRVEAPVSILVISPAGESWEHDFKDLPLRFSELERIHGVKFPWSIMSAANNARHLAQDEWRDMMAVEYQKERSTFENRVFGALIALLVLVIIYPPLIGAILLFTLVFACLSAS